MLGNGVAGFVGSADIGAVMVALLTTVLAMQLLWPMARWLGLVDTPGGRKTHRGAIPLVGGIAMFCGFMIGLSVHETLPSFGLLLMIACTLLVVLGALDDMYGLSATLRLAGQTCVALIVLVGWDSTSALMSGSDSVAIFMAVLIIVTAINAFNMLDGVDGLAGGAALSILFFLGVSAWLMGSPAVLDLVAVVGAAIVGFMYYNIPALSRTRKRSFMGDAGSTFLGFVVAVAAIALWADHERTMSPVVALWIAALPLFEIFTTVSRRLSAGLSPFHADRGHLHHVLERAGLSELGVLVVLLSVSLVCGAIGIGGHHAGVPDLVMLAGFLVCGLGFSRISRRLAVAEGPEPRSLIAPSSQVRFDEPNAKPRYFGRGFAIRKG